MTARSTALQALLQVEVNEGYSNLVLNKALKNAAMEPRENALASALFYGVLERKLTLDYIISQISKIEIAKIEIPVLLILEMAIYQILFLDKIPESAAVNEAVILAKTMGEERASGFINGVLRNFLRKKETILNTQPKGDRIFSLSIRYSCPQWLIRMWEKSYGQKITEDLLKTLRTRPPIFARVNTTLISPKELCKNLEQEGIEAEIFPFLEGTILLKNTGSLEASPSFQKGLFHIQDLSSQLCCEMVGPKAGERILDVCAAPGGKSFTMAEKMEDQGTLEAYDLYKGRVRLIAFGASRLHLSCISASVRDAENSEGISPSADRVLCDAPCSGLGILRRKPEIRYKNAKTLDSLPSLQYRILCNNAGFVQYKGKMIYSTCTLNPKENHAVAERFLQSHPEFSPVSLNLPQGFSHLIDEPENEWTIFPQMHNSDGFFISAFIRQRE